MSGCRAADTARVVAVRHRDRALLSAIGAMRTQIDHGIFDYCGAPVITSELLLPSDVPLSVSHFEVAQRIGRKLFVAKAREAA